MSIVDPECLRLERVMNPKRRQIRDTTQQIERVVGRIAVELVLHKHFICDA